MTDLTDLLQNKSTIAFNTLENFKCLVLGKASDHIGRLINVKPQFMLLSLQFPLWIINTKSCQVIFQYFFLLLILALSYQNFTTEIQLSAKWF